MSNAPDGEPTLEEIADRCREIRKDWSEREHYLRAGYPDGKPVLTIPGARLAESLV